MQSQQRRRRPVQPMRVLDRRPVRAPSSGPRPQVHPAGLHHGVGAVGAGASCGRSEVVRPVGGDAGELRQGPPGAGRNAASYRREPLASAVARRMGPGQLRRRRLAARGFARLAARGFAGGFARSADRLPGWPVAARPAAPAQLGMKGPVDRLPGARSASPDRPGRRSNQRSWQTHHSRFRRRRCW